MHTQWTRKSLVHFSTVFSLFACQAMDLMTACIDRYTVNISSFYSRKMSRLRNGRTILRSQITILEFHLIMRIQIRSYLSNDYRKHTIYRMENASSNASIQCWGHWAKIVRCAMIWIVQNHIYMYIYIYIYKLISSDFHICQIWIWFKELARYFCRIWTSLKGKYRT